MYIVKNKTKDSTLLKIINSWLIEGDYTPDDILGSNITVKEVVYLPLIFYKKKYSGTCSASIGYDRIEDYYEWDGITKRNVRKTRTLIDWHPHQQNISGETSVLIYAGEDNYSSHTNFIEATKWDFNDMIPSEQEMFDSFHLDSKYTLSIEEGWLKRGYNKSYLIAQIQTGMRLPSKQVRNLDLNIEFNDINVFKVVAPYWLINYKYQHKTYFIMIDCSSCDRIEGNKPIDTQRVEEVSNKRRNGWLFGILTTFFLVLIYYDWDLKNFQFHWKPVLIVLFGIIITAIFVEQSVSKLKRKAKNKRENALKNLNDS